MAGYRVKYTLATQLANELVEAADEMTLAKTIARYGRVDLLCIDELGYMQLDRRGAELLFQVLTEREEKASVAIASNESFGGWTKTFTDPSYAQPSSTDSPSAAPSSRPAPTPTVWPKPQSSGQPDTRRARKRCRRKPTSAAPTRARRCQNSPTSGVGRNLRSRPPSLGVDDRAAELGML